MEVRRAEVGDADAIASVFCRSARSAYASLGSPEYLASLDDPTSRATEYARLLAGQRDRWYAVLVAATGKDAVAAPVVGFVEIELDDADSSGVMSRLFVGPEHQSTGIGTLLHDRALDELRAWGCRTARLTVIEGNDRAAAFYRSHGWIPTGERTPFDDHGRTLVDVTIARSL